MKKLCGYKAVAEDFSKRSTLKLNGGDLRASHEEIVDLEEGTIAVSADTLGTERRSPTRSL